MNWGISCLFFSNVTFQPKWNHIYLHSVGVAAEVSSADCTVTWRNCTYNLYETHQCQCRQDVCFVTTTFSFFCQTLKNKPQWFYFMLKHVEQLKIVLEREARKFDLIHVPRNNNSLMWASRNLNTHSTQELKVHLTETHTYIVVSTNPHNISCLFFFQGVVHVVLHFTLSDLFNWWEGVRL